MTRRQPVAFFLGDVSFLADPKFRALQRRLTDPDDFNSAVGAFFIALAAARRNGEPHIDALEETGSKFIPDLQAVGLLNGVGFHDASFETWAPKAPQAIAGQARAASALRAPGGQFKPSDAGQRNQRAGVAGEAGPASPPFPSTPLQASKLTRARVCPKDANHDTVLVDGAVWCIPCHEKVA